MGHLCVVYDRWHPLPPPRPHDLMDSYDVAAARDSEVLVGFHHAAANYHILPSVIFLLLAQQFPS